MDIDTTDLTSYYPGYDEYCECDDKVSFEEYEDMRRELENEVERLQEKLDSISYIVSDIKEKNYLNIEVEIKKIEDIIFFE